MEYIHKETQEIISDDRYKILSKEERKNYQPYQGEDADHGTAAVKNQQEDEDSDDDFDFDFDDDDLDDGEDDDSDFDFGGGSGGGAGADGEW